MPDLAPLRDAYLAKDIRRMAALARARPDDVIAVAGPRALYHLIALFRSGFQRGMSICTDRPNPCGGETIDHVFVCDALDDHRLRALIGSVAPCLSRHASVVARLQDIEQDRVIAETLAAHSVSDSCPVFDASRDLLVSRRFGPAQTFAVAA